MREATGPMTALSGVRPSRLGTCAYPADQPRGTLRSGSNPRRSLMNGCSCAPVRWIAVSSSPHANSMRPSAYAGDDNIVREDERGRSRCSPIPLRAMIRVTWIVVAPQAIFLSRRRMSRPRHAPAMEAMNAEQPDVAVRPRRTRRLFPDRTPGEDGTGGLAAGALRQPACRITGLESAPGMAQVKIVDLLSLALATAVLASSPGLSGRHLAPAPASGSTMDAALACPPQRGPDGSRDTTTLPPGVAREKCKRPTSDLTRARQPEQ